MNSAGLIFDTSLHYLDHLGPFCSLMQWPLLICEDSIVNLACKYYPDLKVIEENALRIKFPKHLVACDPHQLLQAAFPTLLTEQTSTFWLPHGNSDKGWKSPFFEGLQKDATALVYGQKMIDFMKAKNVFLKTLCVGNFRAKYYEKHRSFYQKIVQDEITSLLPQGNKNFLYAPTWNDSEGNGSFWQIFPILAKALPNHCNLLVKLHPNTSQQFDIQLEILMGQFQNRKNILFLPEFPPIYPLLEISDAYIGDMSSIGYDFLKFDRPMYFLNPTGRDAKTDQGLFLFRCGEEILPEQLASVFDLDQKEDFSTIRGRTYNYTFDSQGINLIREFNI
ncbi:MAG: CDP-glycerol glycerophosphotransferase family protein [Chlamydiota bacterium]